MRVRYLSVDAMSYDVQDISYMLQDQGVQAGRPAVFCRFGDCKAGGGRAHGGARAARRFCDADFLDAKAGLFSSAEALTQRVLARWPAGEAQRFVVLTGDEPLLQVDEALLACLHDACFEVAVETRGSIAAPAGLDWISVSPQAGCEWVQTAGDELKLVFPQPGLMPDAVRAAHFTHWLLLPMEGPQLQEHTRAAVEWCLADPRWRLSLQLQWRLHDISVTA